MGTSGDVDEANVIFTRTPAGTGAAGTAGD